MDSIIDNIKNKIKSPTILSLGKIMTEYARVIIIFLFIGYVIAILSIAVKSPDMFTSQPFTIIMLIMIPVLLITFIYFIIGEISLGYKSIAVLSILGITAFIGFILYYFITSRSTNFISKTITYLTLSENSYINTIRKLIIIIGAFVWL